ALAVHCARHLEPNDRVVPLGRRDRRRVEQLVAAFRPAVGEHTGGQRLWFLGRLRGDAGYLVNLAASVAVPPGRLSSVTGPPPLAYLILPLRWVPAPGGTIGRVLAGRRPRAHVHH